MTVRAASSATFFLVALLWIGCQPQEREKEAAPSSRTGALHLYTAFGAKEALLYIEAFQKETGVPVQWVRLSSGELLTRVRNERERPQASVWFGGPFTDFILATQEGLLSPVHPRLTYPMPPGGADPELHWMGISVGAIAFASNREILTRRKLSPPKSWKDLLSPSFRGEVSMAYPYTSGTAYTILASLMEALGRERALQFFQALDRNIHHYNKSGSACVTQAALGEVGVCIAFTQDILQKGVSKGFPVVMTFPKEGTGYEFAGVAMLRGAPEPERAKRFIRWILSKSGQKLMPSAHRIPVDPEISLPQSIPSLRQIHLFPFDAELAGEKKRAWVDLWRRATRT